METKTFSVKDGSLVIEDKHLYLSTIIKIDIKGEEVETLGYIASTNKDAIGLLPLSSTLIRTPKTDEELAEDKYPYFNNMDYGTKRRINSARDGFINGRKSVCGDYHLTREQLVQIASHFFGLDLNLVSKNNAKNDLELMLKKFTDTPIYPNTITVEHDGEKYLWETIKAEY
jgi:hypothetical protein